MKQSLLCTITCTLDNVRVPLLLSLVSYACTSVPPDTVTTFSQGVTQVRQQAAIALKDANALARDASVKYVLASSKPGLAESRFVVAVSQADIDKWDNAFAGIQSYAGALQALLSSDRTGGFADAAGGLATELKNGHAKTELPPGVATAFTQIGEILIQASQQREALAAMQKADPGIREVLSSMAKAIGADPRGKSGPDVKNAGLMGTVFTNWQDALGPSIESFAKATDNKDDGARKAAIDEFLGIIGRRDAELDALASLRLSLMTLADTHTAVARGQKQDAAATIALISQQLDETKKLYDRYRSIEKPKDNK